NEGEYEIANEPEPGVCHHPAGQPTRDYSDNDDDQQTLVGEMHGIRSHNLMENVSQCGRTVDSSMLRREIIRFRAIHRGGSSRSLDAKSNASRSYFLRPEALRFAETGMMSFRSNAQSANWRQRRAKLLSAAARVGHRRDSTTIELRSNAEVSAAQGQDQTKYMVTDRYSDAALKKLRTNTSGARNDGGSNDDGSRGHRHSSDGDGSHSDDGDSDDDDNRTKLRLDPRCRLRLRR